MSGASGGATVRIKLTTEQAGLVKAAVGRGADALVLSIEELEQRIAPTDPVGSFTGGGFRLALNCNQTLLAD